MKRLAVMVLGASLLMLAGCGGGAASNSGNGGSSQNGGTGGDPGGGDGGTDPGAGGGGQNPGGGQGGGTPGSSGDITAVNHVLIMMQENRSFDHYFGAMTDYRLRNNIPINSSDGKIRDLSDAPDFSNVSPAIGTIKPYPTGSVCTEDLTPDWDVSHRMMDKSNPANAGPNSPMDGFASVAYGLSLAYKVLKDNDGHRAMGYFTDKQLNYYYFMASQFAIGDMFFSPVPTRTSSNRLYIHAATSQGSVHADTTTTKQYTAKTIWRALTEKGISWKIYVSDWDVNRFTFFNFFTDSNDAAAKANVVSIDEYFADVAAGTLPSVAFIETGMSTGRDEHPSNNPGAGIPAAPINVQMGAAWTAKIINALMTSPSWKDSVFFWMFDEGGGAFDHVPPITVPNPDNIKPNDLNGGTDCFGQPCSNLDFNITGFRIPNMIVSPFSRKNFVSHTAMDFTAVLHFVEKRWGIAPLTARDAAMPDMQEFFDFTNGGPWANPPIPPEQDLSGVCDFSTE